MKGKAHFNEDEIAQITVLISQKLKASTEDQKKIRNKIRALGFYASDFGLRDGYTAEDFKSVISERRTPDEIHLELIRKYKVELQRTKLKDEIYKWNLLGEFRGRPDPEAKDFTEEIKSTKFQNLLYPMALAVSNHIAREKPEPYRICFRDLFDESKPLKDRIANFNANTLSIYRGIGGKLNHHHDERTTATFLTYHNPERYAFYKDSFYKEYCKLLGIEHKPRGGKYVHYLSLIKGLIDLINRDQELIKMVNELIPDNAYQDPTHTLLAQDILYTILGKTAEEIDIGDAAVFKISMGSLTAEELDECITASVVLVHSDTRGKGTSSESQADVFQTAMGIGDYFYLTHGNAQNGMRLLGRVTGDSMESKREVAGVAGWLQRSFEVIAESVNHEIYKGPSRWWTPNNNSTCIRIKHEELDEANKLLFEPYFRTRLISSASPQPGTVGEPSYTTDTMKTFPLNQILFGPPGTGKTFNSVTHAVAIIEGKGIEAVAAEERAAVKERFDGYQSSGRVVFTTFHQSMSYEDFIEGIKPQTQEEELVYEVKDGIFKNLCVEAAFSFAENTDKADTAKALDFSQSYDQFVESLENTLSGGGSHAELPTRSGGHVKAIEVSPQGNIIVQHLKGERKYIVSKRRLAKLDQEIDNLDDVSNIDSTFREIIGGSNATAYWAVLKVIRSLQPNKSQTQRRTYNQVDKLAAIRTLKKDDFKKSGVPYVLIIDEINRGNIAQIFGELITLIEDDKRSGHDEATEVLLPYSKDRFGVPPNLFIIGTMNTADRSVEALDAALRRRFSFREIVPRPELIKSSGKLKHKRGIVAEINLPDLLTVINNRIEKLLDKDHLIGHSYFLDITELAELKTAFQNKVIPLLQEYFYGDFGKIALVVGKGFFTADSFKETSDTNLFADVPEYDASDLMERRVYRLVNVNQMSDETFTGAIKKLMN